MTDRDALYQTFHELTDTPSSIRDWTSGENEHLRREASLDDKNEFDLSSGRHHAEKVLELLSRKKAEWTDDDYEFAGRVVNYARRSGGIAEHHPHTEKAEVGGTNMTKNEIARRNWGLPPRPEK